MVFLYTIYIHRTRTLFYLPDSEPLYIYRTSDAHIAQIAHIFIGLKTLIYLPDSHTHTTANGAETDPFMIFMEYDSC